MTQAALAPIVNPVKVTMMMPVTILENAIEKPKIKTITKLESKYCHMKTLMIHRILTRIARQEGDTSQGIIQAQACTLQAITKKRLNVSKKWH